MSFIGAVVQAIGPQAVQQYVNVPDFLSRLAAADGINIKGLIKDPEQLQQEQEKAEQMQAMQAFGPKAMDMAGKAMGQQHTPPAEGQGV